MMGFPGGSRIWLACVITRPKSFTDRPIVRQKVIEIVAHGRGGDRGVGCNSNFQIRSAILMHKKTCVLNGRPWNVFVIKTVRAYARYEWAIDRVFTGWCDEIGKDLRDGSRT